MHQLQVEFPGIMPSVTSKEFLLLKSQVQAFGGIELH